MTQDQAGQMPGTQYVPDDESSTAQTQSGPVTRLKKVASALRGDRADQPVTEETVPDPPVAGRPVPGQTGAMVAEDEMYATEPARPDEAGTVRSAGPGYPAAQVAQDENLYAAEPSVSGSGGYGTAAGADEHVPAAGYVNQSGMAAQGLAGSQPGATGRAEDGLRPGEATDRLGDFGDIAFGNLLPDAEQYTAQWQQIQFRFVDDPQGSVTEAAEVISQVTTKLEAAIQERQRAIEERQQAIQERASALRGRWGEGTNADTETLRETLRMYRVFMNQLVGTTR